MLTSTYTRTFLFATTLLSNVALHGVYGQTSYANDFIDPDWIVAGSYPPNTGGAQQTITQWARTLARRGPWSVMDKQGLPPTGDKHDYLSWAPYWWPDCSNAGNTTALTEQEIWVTCEYVRRDGRFNPDVRTVNDIGNFQEMSEAVLYNTLAWSFSKTPSNEFSQNAVRFLRIWFLDEATRMKPHLNFAQLKRGPGEQLGSQTGVLDLKGITKITSAILILKKGGNTDWTTEIDNGFLAWAREYTRWLETSELAIAEGNSANNHGTFYYNQLAALKLLVGDNAGAATVTGTYFSKQFPNQIAADGEQPLEVARTRPYHYRAYNLAAMIVNARIEKYANPSSNVWNRTSASGAGIKAALDHAMKFSARDSDEADYAEELYPNVAAVASIYGDPDKTYENFLRRADPSFSSQPYFLWNQPFAPDFGRTLQASASQTGARAATSTKSTSSKSGANSALEDDEENSALSAMNLGSALKLSMLAASVGAVLLL